MITDDEIIELYDNLTGKISDEDSVRVINLKGFTAAIQYAERLAYLKGMEDGMDRLSDAVQTGLQLSAQ
jgi:hypothetical protein